MGLPSLPSTGVVPGALPSTGVIPGAGAELALHDFDFLLLGVGAWETPLSLLVLGEVGPLVLEDLMDGLLDLLSLEHFIPFALIPELTLHDFDFLLLGVGEWETPLSLLVLRVV